MKKALPGADVLFRRFRFDHLSCLETNKFCTTANAEIDGTVFAVTLDMDSIGMRDVLDLLPCDTKKRVQEWLLYGPVNTIEFPATYLAVAARLGELQKGKFEEFLPLNLETVEAPGGELTPDETKGISEEAQRRL